MKSIKYILILIVLFAVSCTSTPKEDTSSKPDKNSVNPANTTSEKPDKTENKTNNEPPKKETVDNNKTTSNTDDTTKEEKTSKPESDEFTPLYDFSKIDSDDPNRIILKTEHAYIDINFSADKSILKFFSDELTEIGKKHLVKKCIDYVETFYIRVEKWLETGKSKPAYSGVYLYLHEASTKIKLPKIDENESLQSSLLLIMNLSDFSRESVSSLLWKGLVPINSEIVKTGLSIIQPSYKGLKLEDFYKYVPVIRMCISKNDFFNNSSPTQSEMYDLQRADFVMYMLENSTSTEEFLKVCNDESKFKKSYTEWINNRKQFFENDTYPDYYNVLYLWEKDQHFEALNKLSTMMLNDINSEQAEFLDFVNLSFFASRYDFIRKFLESQVLSIDFLFNRMPKEKAAILYDQVRVPIELLIVGVFQGDKDFNQKLVIYLDKIGLVLMSKFLLYAESLLSDIELVRKSGKIDMVKFLDEIPSSYVTKFTWWYQFLLMVSELKYGFVSDAKKNLEELTKLSTTTKEIQKASFAFEHYSK